MIPILKIRLIYVKRNLCKNIFQLFYPLIYILLIGYALKGLKSENYQLINNTKPKSYSSQTFNLYNYQFINNINDQIGVISDNKIIIEQFLEFAHRVYSISFFTIKTFSNEKEYKKHLYSSNYINEIAFDFILVIKGKDKKNLNFEIKSQNLKIRSIYSSSNLLTFNNDLMNTQLNDVERWLNYDIFLTNFLLYLNNISKPQENIKINYKPLTTPPIYNYLSNEDLIIVIPMLISISYSSTLFTFFLWMVKEKEKKLKDLLSRQGINPIRYFFSWVLTFLTLTIIPMIICAYEIKQFFFYNITFFWIFISLFLFSMNIFSMSFVLQSFVNTIQGGQTLLKVVYLSVSILSGVIASPQIHLFFKYILFIFPQITQVENFEVLFALDNYLKGIDSTLFFVPYNKISLFNTFIMYILSFLFDICLGTFFTIYQNSGMDLLPFIKHLFSLNTLRDYGILYDEKNSDIELEEIKTKQKIESNHQIIGNEKEKKEKGYLSIQNITKRYDDLIAVDNFNGELYSNEIFCLLGHNGAGKTTLVKLISRMEKPNKGDIYLNGISIYKNKKYLFQNIGLCNQEDIYFDYLTVREHLKLMSELKGNKMNKEEINNLIEKIELNDKKDSLSSTLSGGQKRKLCVALALCGNSKLVLLDEPTSGMDIMSKRVLWDFLREYKKNKIIILTTHSLEEAEILGDRIGIMNEGKYICSGTSNFLKSKYPCGFNINFIINDKILTREKRIEFVGKLKQIDNSGLIKIASKNILSINFLKTDDNVKELFKEIERIKTDYGIENYTVSTTSLEDVFLKLNNNELSTLMFNQLEKEENFIKSKYDTSITVNVKKEKKQISFKNEIYYNISRNLIPLWRNKSSFILEIISASITIFIYIFGLNSLFITSRYTYQNINELIKINPIYIKSYPIEYFDLLKQSYFYKKNKVKLKAIKYNFKKNHNLTIDDIDKEFYKQSKYKNERSVLVINKKDINNLEFNILYQSASIEYFQSTMNFIISFLLEKYDIKTNFIHKYSNIPTGSKPDDLKDFQKIFVLLYSLIMIWNSFISISGFMITTPLKERINNIKHLLYLSGSNMFAYWLSILIMDIIKFMIFLFLVFPFLIYTDSQYWYHLIVIIPFVFSVNLFVYIFSFLFQKEENGQKFYLLFCLITSILFPCLSMIRLGGNNYFIYLSENTFIYTESDLIPSSSLLIAIGRIFYFGLLKGGGFDNQNKLKYTIFNHSMLFIIQFFIYSFILFLFQIRFFEKLYHEIIVSIFFRRKILNEMQNEISDNNRIIISDDEKKYTTKIINLIKNYFICRGKNIRAVDKMNISLEPNEKFGLLGYNGSGKTTTFKSITNEIFFDEGEIELFNKKVTKNFNEIRTNIGYCPQENALFEYLTVEEILKYYIKLKNINESIKEISERFGLEKYLKTWCTNLSGGNKRKLNFAIALMSYPKILLLDEPSTGVDPDSRRIMWKNINELSYNIEEYNLIISTHSIEEAEILCDTVSWLKLGKFVCVGNPEKLKIEYSNGYYLYINFNYHKFQNIDFNNDDVENIKIKFINFVKGENIINKAIYDKPNLIYSINQINIIFDNIKEYILSIELKDIGKDGSYNFFIHMNEDKKGEFFGIILNMKKSNSFISEVSINMESLENILTKY